MNRPAFHEFRFWLLVAALLLIVAGLFLPRVKLSRDAYDAMAFIDITSSMNTRDVSLHGEPASRLDLIKDRLQSFVASLPCQSKFGLGIFAARRVFVLFEPIEVCENYSGIEASLTELDWRMGWEGDSYIAHGAYDALAVAKKFDDALLFFTDGHEAPPMPWTGLPAFEGKAGEVPGLIIGVGGKTLVPLLKYDDSGREIGNLGPYDVLQENRFGPPPPDVSSRPGWHPRQAPFGDFPVDNNSHMSSVKEDHLKAIADATGLKYVLLGSTASLVREFKQVVPPRDVRVATDIRPYPAGLALLLLVILYGVLPLRERIAGRIHHPTRPKEAHS